MAVSSRILEEFKKGLAAYLAGILETRGLGPLVGKVGLSALNLGSLRVQDLGAPGAGVSVRM